MTTTADYLREADGILEASATGEEFVQAMTERWLDLEGLFVLEVGLHFLFDEPNAD